MLKIEVDHCDVCPCSSLRLSEHGMYGECELWRHVHGGEIRATGYDGVPSWCPLRKEPVRLSIAEDV